MKTAFFIKKQINMKSKIFKISIILGISILSIFAFYLLNKDDSKLSLNQERIFKHSINLEKSIPLDKKLSLMKYNNNQLYFVSWTDNNQGKLFSLNLQNYKFEPEVDLNPELESIIINNYYIENGNISYINKASKSIISFDPKSKLKSTTIYNKNFSRISKTGSNLLVSGWDDNYNMYFEKYNIKTKATSEVKVQDNYFSEYKNNGIALDGVYYENEKYTILLPYAINRAYIFDHDFNYNRKLDLIFDKTAFKFRYTKDKSDLMVDPNNLNPNLSGFLDKNDLFYILTDQSTKWNNRNQCYIDIYDVNNDKYLNSIKIGDYNNSKPRSILINNNKLYVLFEENLNIYNINEK